MTEVELPTLTMIAGDRMTELESRRWTRDCSGPAVLLGLAVDGVGSSLSEADWIAGWVGAGDIARLEWAGGPTVDHIIDLLMPTVTKGEVYGIPGLRRERVEESSATLNFLAAPPTRLHLTRLPSRGSCQCSGRPSGNASAATG